jgi:hypothetical protein
VPFRHSLLTRRQQRVPHFDTNDLMMIKINAAISLRESGRASPEVKIILGSSASQTHGPPPGAGFGNGVAKPAARVRVAAALSMISLRCPLQFCSALVRRAFLLCTLSHGHFYCPHRAQSKTESAIIDRSPATLTWMSKIILSGYGVVILFLSPKE